MNVKLLNTLLPIFALTSLLAFTQSGTKTVIEKQEKLIKNKEATLNDIEKKVKPIVGKLGLVTSHKINSKDFKQKKYGFKDLVCFIDHERNITNEQKRFQNDLVLRITTSNNKYVGARFRMDDVIIDETKVSYSAIIDGSLFSNDFDNQAAQFIGVDCGGKELIYPDVDVPVLTSKNILQIQKKSKSYSIQFTSYYQCSTLLDWGKIRKSSITCEIKN